MSILTRVSQEIHEVVDDGYDRRSLCRRVLIVQPQRPVPPNDKLERQTKQNHSQARTPWKCHKGKVEVTTKCSHREDDLSPGEFCRTTCFRSWTWTPSRDSSAPQTQSPDQEPRCCSSRPSTRRRYFSEFHQRSVCSANLRSKTTTGVGGASE